MDNRPRYNQRERNHSLPMKQSHSNKADFEAEHLIQEHIDLIKTKTSLNVQSFTGTEFQVTFITSSGTQDLSTTYVSNELSLFKNVEMDPRLLSNITLLQYEYVTPIQRVTIPILLQGKDVMACSETGSGKTVAYLFPTISQTLSEQKEKSTPPEESNGIAFPSTLILVPTRELADQVTKECKKLCFNTGVNTVAIYGGANYDKQEQALSAGCDILVGTPGRLTDYLKKGKINLSLVKRFIIDEADRLLDMGFEEQLSVIINNFQLLTKDKRLNMMYSATFNSEVEAIAKKLLNDYYYVCPIKSNPKKIKQELVQANDSEKNEKLCEYLKTINGSALIFLDTKAGVDALKEFLSSLQYSVVSIHGNKNQFERNCAIKDFSKGNNQILIATDIASRGIDFPNVKYVINYDLPRNFDDFIHRIGRTGRMGQEGSAVSFVNERNRSIFSQLNAYMKSQNQPIPKWFMTMNINQRRGQENVARNGRFSSGNAYQGRHSSNRNQVFNGNSRYSSGNNCNNRERSRSRDQQLFRKNY